MIDTFSSFVAGYAVAAGLIVAYVISLWVRSKRLGERLRSASRTTAGTR
jgi:hypothetical protein